jgi:hypothetical protein
MTSLATPFVVEYDLKNQWSWFFEGQHDGLGSTLDVVQLKTVIIK